MGSITNTIKRERKKERDHKPYYIVTEREKKKERKRETDVENIVVYGLSLINISEPTRQEAIS